MMSTISKIYFCIKAPFNQKTKTKQNKTKQKKQHKTTKVKFLYTVLYVASQATQSSKDQDKQTKFSFSLTA